MHSARHALLSLIGHRDAAAVSALTWTETVGDAWCWCA